ncbi:MAG: DUF3696 domain-containing protein [bacterium]
MFTKMRLVNFKAWKDTDEIRLAPLTVFFGGNSSGKTSLLQALLVLKQTAESPDRSRVLHPGDGESTPVDLGTTTDLVFERDESRALYFYLEWQLLAGLTAVDVYSQQSYRGSHLDFEVTVDHSGGRPVVVDMNYRLGDEDGCTLEVGLERSTEKGAVGAYTLTADEERFKPVRASGRPWPLATPTRFYGFPDAAVAYYQNTGFLPDLVLALEQQLGRIAYLGPLRGYPKRLYAWSGEEPSHVGWRGERTVEAMLAAQGRSISPGSRKRYRPFAEVVASWLVKLGLLAEFEVRPIAPGRKEHEVVIRTVPDGPQVNLTDVGFGVSQFLPVIVELFYAPPGSTIILEQPEIHLHPRVQSIMADLFIEAIRAREDGKDRGIQLIVESHSEHFLRRLQRRIAEEALAPDDVALYFAEAGEEGEGSTLSELEVDEYGNIANWPEGFFGDEMEDMIALTEAAMQRMQGGDE